MSKANEQKIGTIKLLEQHAALEKHLYYDFCDKTYYRTQIKIGGGTSSYLSLAVKEWLMKNGFFPGNGRTLFRTNMALRLVAANPVYPDLPDKVQT